MRANAQISASTKTSRWQSCESVFNLAFERGLGNRRAQDCQQALLELLLKPPPAFQFYVDDFLGGTLHFSDAEKGLYITLLCVQWSTGSIPDDDSEILSYSKGKTSLVRVKQKFKKCADGKLRNTRMEIERKKQNAFRRSRSENGKRGGRPPKASANLVLSGSLPLGNSSLSETKAKKSSPTPTPTPTPIRSLSNGFKEPTLEELKLYAAKIGLPEAETIAFQAYHVARGWRYKSGPMKSWRGAMQTWKLNFDCGRFSNNNHPQPRNPNRPMSMADVYPETANL